MFVRSVNHCCVVKNSFTLFCLLSQDMTMIGMFSFDFSCSGKSESFLAPDLVFTFGIVNKKFSCFKITSAHSAYGLLFIFCYYLFFTGDSMIVMRFPSSTGIISTLPYSSRSLAKRSRRTSPCSLKRIERPLKKT